MENPHYAALAEALKPRGVVMANMFGTPVLALGKKPLCGLAEDGIHFKLSPTSEAYEKALALEGAHLFQPEMKGRKGPVMKQWVVVPFAHHARYQKIAEASLAFIAA